jgi:RHS repeat-associated protein
LSRKPETWQYSWDADDRLVAVTTPDGTVWRYRYDPLGRRIAKQHLDADGHITEQTELTWDGATLAEQATVPGPAGGQAQEGEVTTWEYQPGTFSPLIQAERPMFREAAQQEIDQRFYAIVTDLIGAPSELTAPDGTLAGYQQRTLWGATLWHPSGASTPLRFPGQYADPETGLHYNHHRYYDPATGRYLSPDPLGLAPAPNPHTYVFNPTLLTDPLGLDPGGGTAPGGEPTLFRPAGSGWGGRLPMNYQSVSQVAEKYDIDISGLAIKFNKARIDPAGITAPDETITLGRGAFADEEQLARTLAHERYHVVNQLRAGWPYPATRAAAAPYEEAATEFENWWWNTHPLNQ